MNIHIHDEYSCISCIFIVLMHIHLTHAYAVPSIAYS